MVIFSKHVHKSCFNCDQCGKKLTLSDAAINDITGILYCKLHFKEQNRTLKNMVKKVDKKEVKIKGKTFANAAIVNTKLTDDLQKKKDAIYDTELERQVWNWIDHLTGMSIADHGDDGTFPGGLQDGVILCTLVNKILDEERIGNIQVSTQRFKRQENIKQFLTCLRQEFLFLEQDVFETNDLYERSNMGEVLRCLCTLHERAGQRDKSLISGHKLVYRDMFAEKEKIDEQNRAAAAAAADEEEWYWNTDDGPQGPYPAKTLREWYEDGTLWPKAMISNGGDWIRARMHFGDGIDPGSTTDSDDNGGEDGGDDEEEFYLLVDDEPQGPYDRYTVHTWYSNGDIDGDLYVSVDGGDWTTVADCLG